jgi:hypothetical protein
MNKFVLLSLVLASLSGCGIKPGRVEPPEEVQSGEFPRQYPSTETDPPPYVRPR